MNLSSIDRQILGLIEYDPEVTAKSLSNQVRAKPATVNYRLVRMHSSDLIRRGGLVNYAALGLTNVIIYFSLRALPETRFEALRKELLKDSRVAWFGSLTGDFQYGIALFVKHIDEVNVFLYQLSERLSLHISQKAIVARTSLICFNRGYIAQKSKRQSFVIQRNSAPEILDELDGKILNCICNQPWNSVRDITRAVGSYPATIERRLERLTSEKQLLRMVYYINTDLLGMGSYRLLLSSQQVDAKLRQILYQFCNDQPYIIRLFESIGTWDFEIDLEAPGPLEVRKILQDLDKVTAGNVSGVRVLAEVEDYKLSFYPL